MSDKRFATMDGNEAASYVAFSTNEVIALYPITPSSPMGENSDLWASAGQKNIWGSVPKIIEMQSEGGAAGAVHGSLQTGALSTTFTASQGLLLMIPNMYKIAGELTSTVFHVSARTIATHALSIFGDHGDVMATRQCGWAMLASGSVQEAMDMALIAQASTLKARVPFIHFFEGFRISHEISKIIKLTPEEIRSMINDDLVRAHRERALSCERPKIRGTAQNPDVYFQARESSQPYYNACPNIVQETMDEFAKLTGRAYHLFDYYGDPQAETVVAVIGCGAFPVKEAVDYLNANNGEKLGVLRVRLYRPFDCKRFMEALPSTVKNLVVLDRTKEPGASGEPLYQDCVAALAQGLGKWGSLSSMPKVCGGRYGLSSKEFTPAMAKGIFDAVKSGSIQHGFTVGINDDVLGKSIKYDPSFSTEPSYVTRALFYGLGSDGTVGANKNSVKIIAGETDNYAQAYFVYDSKKAGSITTSHLRFGPKEIQSPYLIFSSNFVACHQSVFLDRYDMLSTMEKGGTFLINIAGDKEHVWDKLPKTVQQTILDKKLKLYVIDAYKVAKEAGMGMRINTIMQTCFFAISGVLPKEEAIESIKKAIKKTYGRKGEEVVNKNLAAVDATLANLFEVSTEGKGITGHELPPAVSDKAPKYVKEVLGEIYAGRGEKLPVSAMSPDGTFPTATSKWEKRNIALEVPVWDPNTCIQCGKCSLVCSHAAIRMKAYDSSYADKAPSTFKCAEAKNKAWKEKGYKFTVQVAPEDCTGCGVCISACPAKNKETGAKAINFKDVAPIKEEEKKNFEYFMSIPDIDRATINNTQVREQQVQRALFEFSGACAGCGETPYVKLLSQLFGDRAYIANATGCSSIYGGNLPTTPWCQNDEGRGPTWANSLFEDNAEFGVGYRVSIDKQTEFAKELLKKLSSDVGDNLVQELLAADQSSEAGIQAQRQRVKTLKDKLASVNNEDAKMLLSVADMLVKKSVWILGGDGWAYDIGYGGLDHALYSGLDINILVLDTEVYSNTGGQMSKSTPRGAVAKFAESGKHGSKKDLGAIAMMARNVYVGSISIGAKDSQALKTLVEAENYKGPSIVLAYAPCISHGITMSNQLTQQELAVNSGRWLLYRYNPDLIAEGKNPLSLDSKEPSIPVEESMLTENRFRLLTKTRPEEAKVLFKLAQEDVNRRYEFYKYMAAK